MENLEDMELDQVAGLEAPEGAGELSLPQVVLRVILENLSSTDLLKVSLVDKSWHYEALSVLRGRGTLTANMNSADGRCKDLRAFASDLQRMKEVRKVVPFYGLTIGISGANDQHGDWCNESSPGELDQVYVDILHQMDFKHLTLDLSRHAVRGENCAGFKLVKKILQNRFGVLQEFSLKIGSNRQAFIQHFLQHCNNFSSLTTLKFKDEDYHANEDFMKTLVSRSPKLKVLSTDCYYMNCYYMNLKANLLEGRAAGVVHAIDDSFNLCFDDEIPESVAGRLKLRNIWLMHRSYRQDFNLHKFDRMTRMMLQRSRSTLTSIRVESIYLVPWTNYGMDLRNVRRLDVTLYESDASEARLRGLLKSFDFSQVFPNLSSVDISYLQGLHHPSRELEMNALIDMAEQGNPAALIPPPNRTANIKKLSMDWRPNIPDSFTRFLVQMFPHVEKLVVRARISSLFTRFWDHWEELEEIDLTMEISPGQVVEHVDSAICGIFPQEVAQLLEQDEDYLRKVNIVPVMPSLCSFKRLRTLNVYFCGLRDVDVDPTSTISKVTGLIGFRRIPGLTVTLETNMDSWRQELERMEPYATVQMTHRFGRR